MSSKSRAKKVRKPSVRTTLMRGELDGRTTLARGFDRIKGQITEALGGQVTPMQEILIERAIFKTWRCVKMEERMLMGKGEDLDGYTKLYLSWANSVRADFNTLGLTGKRPAEDALANAFKVLKESG